MKHSKSSLKATPLYIVFAVLFLVIYMSSKHSLHPSIYWCITSFSQFCISSPNRFFKFCFGPSATLLQWIYEKLQVQSVITNTTLKELWRLQARVNRLRRVMGWNVFLKRQHFSLRAGSTLRRFWQRLWGSKSSHLPFLFFFNSKI